MSRSAAKNRYTGICADARRQAATKLVPIIGVDFHLTEWSRRCADAIVAQWEPSRRKVAWDWNEILRRHHDPDRLDMALWCGDRLSGIGLCITTGQAVDVRFLEGDPRSDCPLKRSRSLIFFECAANYAQARGKTELRASTTCEELVIHYTQNFGFKIETPRRGPVYYRKPV